MDTISKSLAEVTRGEELVSVEEELRKVEDVASQWAERARALRFRKNALQPFSKISLEILQEIFLFLSRGDDSDSFVKSSRTPWDWLVVTWVCHDWREAAMGFSKLWTLIKNFKHSGRVEAYLERSRKMRIDVHLGMTPFKLYSVPLGSLKLLGTHINRIKDLALGVGKFPSEWEDIEGYFARDSLPRLKNLRLCNRSIGQSKTLSNFKSTMRLNTLCLQHVRLPWGHSVYQNLSELHLEDIDESAQPTLANILDILDDCPRLKTLKLIDAGPSTHILEQDTDDMILVVDLPYLQYIKLGAVDESICEALFNHLDYPPKIMWDVTITGHDFNEYMEDMVPNILELERGHEELTLTIFDDRISFESIGEKDKHPSTLTLMMEWRELIFGDVFSRLDNFLSSSYYADTSRMTIVVAAMGMDPLDGNFLTKRAWEYLWMELYTVRDLTLIFESQKGLEVRCLQALTETTTSPYLDSPMFSGGDLQFLSIELANFDSEWNEGEDLVTLLFENLCLRNKYRKRLKKLSFVGCSGIEEGIVNVLRQLDYCDEVYWES